MNHNNASTARPVAFFDFDGTLTTGDTLMPFLKFVVGTPAYYVKLAVVSPVLGAYFAKMLHNDLAKQILLKQYLAGYNVNDLFELGQRFSEEVIPTMLRPEGMERLRWHHNQGHECVLVSASMDVYLKHWSRANGFSAVLTTQLDTISGAKVSGRIKGRNCCGKEKERQVRSYLDRENFGTAYTYGYGNSPNDWAMLAALRESYLWQKTSFVSV